VSTRLDGLPVRRTDVVLVDDGERSMLVAPDQDGTHVLNPTARAIWELCDGVTLPAEMVAAICEVFAVTPERAAADVDRTLEELTRVGLIAWPPPAGRLDP
jgi:hypothetical protein